MICNHVDLTYISNVLWIDPLFSMQKCFYLYYIFRKALKLSKVEHRLFPKLTAVAPSQSLSSSFTSQESMDLTNSLPLSGFSVCIVGKLERKKVSSYFLYQF